MIADQNFASISSNIEPFDFRGGGGDDDYDLIVGQSEVVKTKGGSDYIYAPEGALDQGDRIDGGAGQDFLEIEHLDGKFVFSSHTLTNVEVIFIDSGKYSLVLDDNMVAAGSFLFIGNFGAVSANVDGSAETNGTLSIGGSSGDDVIIGGAYNDNFDGFAGNDRLTGGAGIDTFVVDPFGTGTGRDIFTDFKPGEDKIYFEGSQSTVKSFDDLNIVEKHGNAVILGSDGDKITLLGVDVGSLTPSDFIFDESGIKPSLMASIHTHQQDADLFLHHFVVA